MVKCEHNEGDVRIAIEDIGGVYVVTLSEGTQGLVRSEKTTSWVRAVYEYTSMICNDLATFAADEADQVAIESIPTIEGGTW